MNEAVCVDTVAKARLSFRFYNPSLTRIRSELLKDQNQAIAKRGIAFRYSLRYSLRLHRPRPISF